MQINYFGLNQFLKGKKSGKRVFTTYFDWSSRPSDLHEVLVIMEGGFPAVEWISPWIPIVVSLALILATGTYILLKNIRPLTGAHCCSIEAGRTTMLDEGRDENLVDNVNPPVDTLPRFTPEELQKHNGEGGNRLLVGVQGLVYDVGAHEAGRQFYGPGGSYNLFAGRDATAALAKMALERSLLNSAPSTWSSFNDEQRRCIHQWAVRFCFKYPLAGVVDFGSTENELAAKWRAEAAETCAE